MLRFDGKTIMILGASAHITEAVELAKKKGLRVIVTDPDPKAPAKALADKAYDLSCMESEKITEICRKEKVDGVFLMSAHVVLPSYYRICSALGLPSYGNEELFETFFNKRKFKDACRKYGVDVIEEISGEDLDDPEKLDESVFPIIIKPTDSASSRGITVVRSKENVKKAVEFARSESKTGEVVAERFMTGNNIGVWYTIKDYEVSLGLLVDRCINYEKDSIWTPYVAHMLPSMDTDLYIRNTDAKVRHMLRSLGVRDGVWFCEAFRDGNTFRFYDPGYRISGVHMYRFLDKINGINHMEMLMDYAMTGHMGDVDLMEHEDPYLNGTHNCLLSFPVKNGTIKEIRGLDRISGMEDVFFVTPLLAEGDSVGKDAVGTLHQLAVLIYITAQNEEKLTCDIKEIEKLYDVLDEEGRSMLTKPFDIDEYNRIKAMNS